MALTEANRKYWEPDAALVQNLANRLAEGAKVLEVGPGEHPFPRATQYVDVNPPKKLQNCVQANFTNEGLPFADKEFDFVYCRHVLEDLWNPFRLCEEMSRVAKAGYVECPSPMAELTRGVDGSSPPFRGYHHHRWIVWTFGKELRFITKYPFIEYVQFPEEELETMLKSQRYWNTYHLWEGEIRYHQFDNNTKDYSIPRDYALILGEAVARSREMTDIYLASLTK